jgi:C-terminal processing protease CtpA/Prc
MIHFSKLRFQASFAFLILAISYSALAQQPVALAAKRDREKGQDMLKAIKEDIKKNYYDEKFRGIDIEARFKIANEKIETAASNGQIFGIIAQAVIEFEDSHTRFVPPSRSNRTEYGWKMKMIGDKAFVTTIKPKSDAELKGLKVGDEVLSIDGFGLDRKNLWKLKYFYYSLRPQPGMRVLVRHPDNKEEELLIAAKITQGKKVLDLTGSDIWDLIRKGEDEDYFNRHRYLEIGKDIFVWKMPEFDLQEYQVDDMMEKAKKHNSIIIDLRGNGGGAVKMLNRLLGNCFEKDVKIADWVGRKKFDPQIAKTRGADKAFKGKIVALIDSESASASEIFSRVMQLEKRGTVIGDRSAGAVMVSRYYPRQLGVDTVSYFGSSITMADLIMTDGKSLENLGVIPDEILLPSALDQASQNDPVMARAAELLGVKLDKTEAGKMFPFEWTR